MKKTFRFAVTGVAAVLSASTCLCGTALAADINSGRDAAWNYSDNIYYGCTGEPASYVQQLLYDLGYRTIEPDGEFGSVTESDLIKFQSDYGINANGIVDYDTLAALESANGMSAYSQSTVPSGGGAASATDSVYLRQGDTNDYVADMQTKLAGLGYYTGDVDGYFGPYTMAAVQNFQMARNLYVDGEAGPYTLAALEGEEYTAPAAPAAPAVPDSIDLTNVYLRQGDTNNEVTWLQQKLVSLGYYTGDVDGYFGPYTYQALINYQTAKGLYADGEAGPYTLSALEGVEYTAPAAQAAPEAPAVTAARTVPDNFDLSNVYLRQGDDSDAVVWLQQKLSALGYYSAAIDGYFGAVTYNAVTAYQSAQGLGTDGEAGPYTLAALSGNNALITIAQDSAAAAVRSQAETLAQNKLNEVGWNLEAAYNWVVNTGYNNAITGTTVSTAATAIFQNGSGDCTARAASFALMARQLGYDCKVITGTIPYTNGTNAEHTWTEITVDGRTYVCDPDFEWEKKVNGYMINYGDSGTWVYQNMRNFPE